MGTTNRLVRSVAIGAALMVFGAGAWASELDRRDTFGFVIGETTHKEAQQILKYAGAEPSSDYNPMTGYRYGDMKSEYVKDILPLLPHSIHVKSGYAPFEVVGPVDEAWLSFSSRESGSVLWEISVSWEATASMEKESKKTARNLLDGLKSLYGPPEEDPPYYYFTKPREGRGDVKIEAIAYWSELGSNVRVRYTDEALEDQVEQERQRADEAIAAAIADRVKGVL